MMNASGQPQAERRINWRSVLSPSAPWLYLVYLSFFFIGWVYDPPGFPEIGFSIVALAGFIAIYVVAMRRRDGVVIPAVAACAALSLAFEPYNWGGAIFVVFGGAMLARANDLRIRNFGLAILIVLIVLAMVWLGYPAIFIAAVLGSLAMTVIGSAYGAWREERDAQIETRRMAAERRATEAERARIARDLHDLLGQTLTMITLKSELTERLLDSDPQRARHELSEIRTVSRKALAEMREAVTGLRQYAMSDAIRESTTLLEAGGVTFRVQGELPSIPPEYEGALVMGLREGSTNILRHADATSATLSMSTTHDRVCVSLADNGKGGACLAGPGGLAGLAERLKALGGSLQTGKPDAGPGSRLDMTFPIGEPNP